MFLLAGAVLLSVAAGCGGAGTEDGGTVPDSVYVEAMARMVLLDTDVSPTLEPPLSGPALDSARSRVLEHHGVDAGELLEFARTRGGDPEQMQAIWQRVDELSRQLKDEEWRPLPDSAAPTSRDALPDTVADTSPATGGGSAETVGEAGSGEGGR